MSEVINSKRKVKLASFIYAIGIRHVGVSNAKLLAEHFSNYSNFKQKLITIADLNIEQRYNNIDYNDLAALDGLGGKIIEAIIEFFSQKENLLMLNKLEMEIEFLDHNVVKSEHEIFGKSVVFTGTLENISRKEAKEQAESIGVKVLGSVSVKLDFLVAGDKAGSKLKKAKEFGIKILTESEWQELISHK